LLLRIIPFKKSLVLFFRRSASGAQKNWIFIVAVWSIAKLSKARRSIRKNFDAFDFLFKDKGKIREKVLFTKNRFARFYRSLSRLEIMK